MHLCIEWEARLSQGGGGILMNINENGGRYLQSMLPPFYEKTLRRVVQVTSQIIHLEEAASGGDGYQNEKSKGNAK